MFSRRSTGLLLLLVAALAASGCAPTAEDDSVAEGSDALTALPTGTFAIADLPLSGSYVARLTLQAGKKFEMEYVRRTSTTEPWVLNPWVPVPVTHEERLVLRGTWFTYAGDHGSTMVSFDVTDGDGGSYVFEVAKAPGALKLTTIDDRTFELRVSSAAPEPTDKRVIRCDALTIKAVITLDEAQRRRGTLRIERKAAATASSPPERTTPVVYTGGTGVDDYMSYEGHDSDGNGYEFALRESDLEKTSGPIAEVGLGFFPESWIGGGGHHNSLTCTIGTE